MPYKSQAQAAYFNIHKKELEKQGVDVGEWNAAKKNSAARDARTNLGRTIPSVPTI